MKETTMYDRYKIIVTRDSAVRPQGALGTCGWAPEPWTVQYVRARSAEEALRKATGDQQ